jgi:hypothetical protein
MTHNAATDTPLCALMPIPSWPTGVGRPRRLFFTPQFLTRFQANWTSSTVFLQTAKNTVNSWINDSTAGGAVAQALNFLASGNATFAHTAASRALATPYATIYSDQMPMTAEPAAFVLDWCYDALTSTERTNLIAQLESRMTTHINGLVPIHTHETQKTDYFSILFGCMAIQGEAGTTDRGAIIRNCIQNYAANLNEANGDGLQPSYQYQEPFYFFPFLAWEIGTGIPSGLQWFRTRPEGLARIAVGNILKGSTAWVGDQCTRIEGVMAGAADATPTANIFVASTVASYAMAALLSNTSPGDPLIGLWQWMGDQGNTLYGFGGYSPWVGLAMYDSTITSVAPSTFFTKKNHYFDKQRAVNFRSGWSASSDSNVDVRVNLKASQTQTHSHIFAGDMQVFRGLDDLLVQGSYPWQGNSGRGYYIMDGAENGLGWTWSSFSRNTVVLATDRQVSSTPDTDGQQITSPTFQGYDDVTNGNIWYPQLTYSAGTNAFRCGNVTLVDLPAGDAYGMAGVEYAESYAPGNVSVIKRKMCCIPGALPGQMTIIVRDQFVGASAATKLIKWGFFTRSKPTVVSLFNPVQLAGTPTAGHIVYNASVISRDNGPTITYALPAATQFIVWQINSGKKSYSNNLKFFGNAVAGATVNVYVGASLVGSTTADAAGLWSFVTGPQADGTLSFSATQTIGAGPESQHSPPFVVTIKPSITSFNATSGSTSSISGLTLVADNGNKTWSVAQLDSHTLQFEIRSGDVATVSGTPRTDLSTTGPTSIGKFDLLKSMYINYEFKLTSATPNDQFGAGKYFRIGEADDTLSNLRSAYETTLGGEQVPASNGDMFSLDVGRSPNITSATYTNLYTGSAPITRNVWHTVDILLVFSENATDNTNRGQCHVYLDGVSIASINDFTQPLGYYNPSPVIQYFWRMGISQSAGTITQQIQYRNFLMDRLPFSLNA